MARLVQQHTGSTAHWFNSTLVQQHTGSTAHWFNSSLVQQLTGSRAVVARAFMVAVAVWLRQ